MVKNIQGTTLGLVYGIAPSEDKQDYTKVVQEALRDYGVSGDNLRFVQRFIH